MSEPSTAEALLERLARYPAARYPVQHATTRFHLGSLKLAQGDPLGAGEQLAIAMELFAGLPVERAKSRLLWGAAMRAAGRLHEAISAFTDASAAFEQAAMPMERAAALFNLGLVQNQAGQPARAAATLAGAAADFEALGAEREASAARRERAAALVAAGGFEEAILPLRGALAAAEASGDEAARGQAANALGLAYLGMGDPDAAIAAFQQALSAHPRAIRPDAHAMAKANLAVTYEAMGAYAHARLAAAQALCVPAASEAIHSQAADVLDRLGEQPDDLLAVLAAEPSERWCGLIREEVVRWLSLDSVSRQASVDPLVAAIGRPAGGLTMTEGPDPEALAEAWLAVLVELPPDRLDTIVEATLRAPDAAGDDFRSVLRTAILGFPAPQLLRLETTFAVVGARTGWR